MANALTFGAVDLLSASYETTQLPNPAPSRIRRIDPRWNSPTNQSGILGRSQLVHATLEFQIVCKGDGSYNTALTRFTAIKTVLDNTRTYWRTQGAQGANATLSRNGGDQATPTVYTVFEGEWIDAEPNRVASGHIWARLTLLCWEGSVTAGAVHAPIPAGTASVPAVQLQSGGTALKFFNVNNSGHLVTVLI